MPRPANPSTSAEALIRAHFGLSQQQLARYLGVSPGYVAHLEAGRKVATLAHTQQLTPLALLLPPPEGYGPPLPPAAEATPANPAALPDGPGTPLNAAPLLARQRSCRLQAAALARQLRQGQARADALARRRRGLAQLQALPPAATPVEAARRARWLAELAEDLALADPTPTATATALVLLAVRHDALLAEAAALARLLPPPTGTG